MTTSVRGTLVRVAIYLCVSIPAYAGLILPSAITAEATGPGGATVGYTVLVEGADTTGDGRQTETVSCSPASLSLFPIGTTTVSCVGSEGSTGNFTVTVQDSTAPLLSLPSDINVITANTSEIVAYDVSAVDLVDGSVPVACLPASGSSFPFGSTIVSCSATDAHGNSSAGSFAVTLASAPPPPGPNPLDITAEATSTAGAKVLFRAGTGEDDTGRTGVGCTPASGSLFPLGSTTVQCPSATFIVTIVDTTPPALDLPGTVTATSSTPVAVSYSVSATDLVDGPVSVACTPPSGSTFDVGSTTVSCSATDAHGNNATGSFSVLVSPAPPPTPNPNDVVAEATGPSGAVVTYPPTFDSGGRLVVCTPPSGSLFPLGETTVQCDNSTTFTVTVVDTTPPTLNLPGPLTLEATSAAGATGTFTATATDLVDGSVLVSCAPPSGSTFPLGGTTVSCTAADAAGNAATGSFTVTVVDTTPPTLNLPAPLTLEATSAAGATGTFTATATDLVDGSVPVSCAPSSGSTFPLGVTTVSCSASDTAGNGATGSFTVTVVDTTPPEIVSITASPDRIWPPNGNLVDVTLIVEVTDAVDPSPLVRIYDITSNETIGTDDAIITGLLTAQLRADRDPHGQGRVYAIFIEAIDLAGNLSTATVSVAVPHDERKRSASRR